MEIATLIITSLITITQIYIIYRTEKIKTKIEKHTYISKTLFDLKINGFKEFIIYLINIKTCGHIFNSDEIRQLKELKEENNIIDYKINFSVTLDDIFNNSNVFEEKILNNYVEIIYKNRELYCEKFNEGINKFGEIRYLLPSHICKIIEIFFNLNAELMDAIVKYPNMQFNEIEYCKNSQKFDKMINIFYEISDKIRKHLEELQIK